MIDPYLCKVGYSMNGGEIAWGKIQYNLLAYSKQGFLLESTLDGELRTFKARSDIPGQKIHLKRVDFEPFPAPTTIDQVAGKVLCEKIQTLRDTDLGSMSKTTIYCTAWERAVEMMKQELKESDS